MIKYSYTDVIEYDPENDSDDSVSTYWYYGTLFRRWFSIYILIEDDSACTKDDSVFTYWDVRGWSSWDRW